MRVSLVVSLRIRLAWRAWRDVTCIPLGVSATNAMDSVANGSVCCENYTPALPRDLKVGDLLSVLLAIAYAPTFGTSEEGPE
jgi:hypothetical protein